ncbi:MAG: hypothetical protein ACU836_09080 [Gammaproteobacteria bacterium]
MSEYTQYFAVRASSGRSVKDKLQAAKVLSLVDDDSDDYGFLPEYKRHGNIQWVAVLAPALWEPTYRSRLEDIRRIFESGILFFQEENCRDWSLSLWHNGDAIEKKFYDYEEGYEDDEEYEEIHFSDAEKRLISNLFHKDFGELEPLMQPGNAERFLNFVGIPYMELNDQNQVRSGIAKEGEYSILVEDISD